MVRETKTLGQGDVGVPEPRHLPTVRNIVVYGKKKIAINLYFCPYDAYRYFHPLTRHSVSMSNFCRFFTTSGKLGANVGRPAGVRCRRLASLAVDM